MVYKSAMRNSVAVARNVMRLLPPMLVGVFIQVYAELSVFLCQSKLGRCHLQTLAADSSPSLLRCRYRLRTSLEHACFRWLRSFPHTDQLHFFAFVQVESKIIELDSFFTAPRRSNIEADTMQESKIRCDEMAVGRSVVKLHQPT